VWEAAWARSTGRSTARLAPMAKLFACQTFRDVTAMAQQVFGGVGFTVDYDIQLYFRRAKQLQLSWWDPRYLEELVAVEVLDADGA
jgi:alkylation response protein AidB-like acyl-CoA dehydrogenase